MVTDFAPIADPALYVSRPATERVLAELERAALAAGTPGVLLAPAGFGKTLLLRVLAARLGDRLHPVYLSHSTLPQSELCALALGLMNVPGGAHPEVELLSLAADLRAAGSGLLLLVDDAEGLHPAAARGLAGLAAVSHGGLRLVLAGLDDARGYRLLDALGEDAEAVVLGTAMNEDETSTYVRRRIGRADASDPVSRLLAPEILTHIHKESGGVPARVPSAIVRIAV